MTVHCPKAPLVPHEGVAFMLQQLLAHAQTDSLQINPQYNTHHFNKCKCSRISAPPQTRCNNTGSAPALNSLQYAVEKQLLSCGMLSQGYCQYTTDSPVPGTYDNVQPIWSPLHVGHLHMQLF